MKDFIPYNEALALKELGFEEKCDYYFTPKGEVRQACGFFNYPKKIYPDYIKRPTFSQAFRFFRKKYKLHGMFFCPEEPIGNIHTYEKWCFSITKISESEIYFSKYFDSYEEAELECLKKLISVVS